MCTERDLVEFRCEDEEGDDVTFFACLRGKKKRSLSSRMISLFKQMLAEDGLRVIHGYRLESSPVEFPATESMAQVSTTRPRLKLVSSK